MDKHFAIFAGLEQSEPLAMDLATDNCDLAYLMAMSFAASLRMVGITNYIVMHGDLEEFEAANDPQEWRTNVLLDGFIAPELTIPDAL